MRDTQRLRSRLVWLASSSLWTGCDAPSPASPVERPEAPERSEAGDAPTPARPKASAPSTAAPAPRRAADADRFAPIPGDPPYIDGYNPEEAPCVSGNWCGDIESAKAIAASPNIPMQMGCPTKVSAPKDPSIMAGTAYVGISSSHSMQGALNGHGTELAREDGRETACCYHWFEYCSGRPLREGDARHVASVEHGDAWLHAEEPCSSMPERLPEADRVALADAWLADALDEHASVAAFARLTMELMAHGAPAPLVASVQRAALDEIDHAQRCFSLASRFAGRTLSPGPLPIVAPRQQDLAQFAVDTFVEGCFNETVAALAAERALQTAVDAQVRRALHAIAADEARHAALAWRVLAWTLENVLGRHVEVALRERCEKMLGELDETPPNVEPWERSEAWGAFGRLDAADRQAVMRDAYTDIVLPMLEELLAEQGVNAEVV